MYQWRSQYLVRVSTDQISAICISGFNLREYLFVDVTVDFGYYEEVSISVIFYRAQVNLGSYLWVRMSVSE